MFSFINVTIRGISLGTRFLLIFVLAKYMLASDVGLFGVASAIITYGVFVSGSEFYNYSLREFILPKKLNRGSQVVSQLVLYSCTYLFLSPLVYFLFFVPSLGVDLGFIALFILISEHLSQEMNRLLNAANRQLQASVVLFFRTAAWSFWVVPSLIYKLDLRNLHFVFLSWLCGNCLALMLAMFFLRSEVSMKGAIVDWEWIKNGFFVSFKYLFAMVFLKTIFFVDKLFVRQFCLPDQLGAYIYYIGGAAAIASFADAAIYVYRYPNLVRVASKGDAKQFAYVFRQMVLHAAVFSFLMLLSAGLFYLIVNHALGNEVYSAYYYQGLVLFSAMFFFSISMAFHYGLYALREDKKIVVSNFISLMTFLSLVVFLGRSGEYRVPLSLLSSMFLLCLIKAIYFKKSHNGFVFSLGKSLI